MLDAQATFEDFIAASDEEREALRLSYPKLYAAFKALKEKDDFAENLTFYQTPEGEAVIISGDVDDDFFDANYDSYEDYLKQKKE